MQGVDMKEVDTLYKSPTVTPQIFSDLFEYYEDDKKFTESLTELINTYNIGSKFEMSDFLIAEMIRNNLATVYNTQKANKRLQK